MFGKKSNYSTNNFGQKGRLSHNSFGGKFAAKHKDVELIQYGNDGNDNDKVKISDLEKHHPKDRHEYHKLHDHRNR